jgi:Co/Zn/Cd efflux system component
LLADALDFLADALTYGLSLAVIGMPQHIRSNAAIAKGVSLFALGAWVLGSTVYRIFVLGAPSAHIMGMVGALALASNLLTVLLLVRYKDGDANVRSVWLCSRNDALSNIAVMLAAIGVWGSGSAWPDLLVALLMAGLFMTSATQILRQALREKTLGPQQSAIEGSQNDSEKNCCPHSTH